MKGQAVHCATVEVVHKGVFLNTYTAIVWATLAGWLLWRELVTVQVMAGTGVVIASNLFLLRRSQLADRK